MVNIRNVLTATDFSSYSREALDYAVHLVKTFQGKLYLLHVFQPTGITPEGALLGDLPENVREWIKQVKNDEAKKLNKLADEIRNTFGEVETLLKTGVPFLEILKTADEVSADLIVMSTHGRTGLAHVLIGSVAERVVRKASCPVLTVKPKGFFVEKRGRGVGG